MADMDEIADLFFSLFISYVGALEFLYVVRHLYHWSFRHDAINQNEVEDSLQTLQDNLRSQLSGATEREERLGHNVMQDGVLYEDGFRIDPAQMPNDITSKEAREQRQKEIQAELERQKKIEEETRKQLDLAEKALAEERERSRREAEENERRLFELERAKEEEQRLKEQQEAEKLLELESAKEEEQRLFEFQKAQEEAERLLELERAREEEQRLLELERAREEEQRLLELQKAQEEEERLLELQEAEKLLAFERAKEEEQRLLELQEEEREKATNDETDLQHLSDDEEALEFARQLIAQDKLHQRTEESPLHLDIPDDSDLDPFDPDLMKKMLGTTQMSPEQKQHLIDENARKFLEAEKELVDMLEACQVPVEEPLIQKVTIQMGQTSADPYRNKGKKTVPIASDSDEGSSLEPNSSQQSSFRSQPSEGVPTTGPEERQEPDGEDTIPDIQYSDDYLRSLDGIKHRPIVREDGSGRRRAYKKRRSSGSSNSSRDSRTSRDDELKMFTSLEEEEMQKQNDDYIPIKYTSEPNLKVKTLHRRHKRSPAKDSKPADDPLRASLEMLGEEGSNPWGEVAPEHYKDTEFWKREKAMSIDEEEIEMDLAKQHPDFQSEKVEEETEETALEKHKTSSFEEASPEQNQEAAEALQQQQQIGNEALDPANQPTSASAAATDNT